MKFVFVIVNVETWLLTFVWIITQFAEHFKKSSTSQLIKGISRVLQKLLNYFSGTIISTLIIPLLLLWPVILVLKLNKSLALAPLKSTISPSLSISGIFLQYCHRLPDVF